MQVQNFTEENWKELLDYLLDKLSESLDSDLYKVLLADMNTQIIYEKEIKLNRKGLSVREKSNKEKFKGVVDYLQTILVEVPLIAKTLSKNLERPPEEIQFVSDSTSSELITEEEGFLLGDLIISKKELDIIRKNLDILYLALGERGEFYDFID